MVPMCADDAAFRLQALGSGQGQDQGQHQQGGSGSSSMNMQMVRQAVLQPCRPSANASATTMLN